MIHPTAPFIAIPIAPLMTIITTPLIGILTAITVFLVMDRIATWLRRRARRPCAATEPTPQSNEPARPEE